jgi:hypothetical protein
VKATITETRTVTTTRTIEVDTGDKESISRELLANLRASLDRLLGPSDQKQLGARKKQPRMRYL